MNTYLLAILTSLVMLLTPTPGSRDLGQIENIHGIPYPRLQGDIYITEPLAHADIYLKEPPLAKQLQLTVKYTPVNLDSLAVGIRENSFWLSYEKTPLPTPGDQTVTHTLTIPLTDKLPDQDGSVDLMFFAEPKAKPLWKLHSLTATVQSADPSWTELKNYVKSILTREQPL